MNRRSVIPRFALPYSSTDTAVALEATFAGKLPATNGFDELLGPAPKFWTGSGRQALWLLLRALRFPPGTPIATPSYNDSSVMEAIVGAGFKPVFVEVDESTLCMDPAGLERVRDRVKAVMVTHLFGNVARVDEIMEVAKGLPVIEDTAHAPLSYLNGKMVGKTGIGCFYSFASTKYWPAGGGGLLLVNDPGLLDHVKEDAAQLGLPGRLSELRNVAMQAAKAAVFHRSYYGAVGRPLRSRAERLCLLEPVLDMHTIKRNQAAVALRHVRTFPALVERQRRNSLRLLELLPKAEGIVLPVERPGAQYNYHLFAVLASSKEERDALRRGMLKRKVDTSMLYFDAVPKMRRVGYQGGCPIGESMADRILTLPNYAVLTDEDVQRVAESFQEALEEYRSSRIPVPSLAHGGGSASLQAG